MDGVLMDFRSSDLDFGVTVAVWWRLGALRNLLAARFTRFNRLRVYQEGTGRENDVHARRLFHARNHVNGTFSRW